MSGLLTQARVSKEPASWQRKPMVMGVVEKAETQACCQYFDQAAEGLSSVHKGLLMMVLVRSARSDVGKAKSLRPRTNTGV